MPEGDERRTSITREEVAGVEETDRPLATAMATYVATLGRPRESGGWKHEKPLKDWMAPCTSGGSWIKTKEGQRELVTTF